MKKYLLETIFTVLVLCNSIFAEDNVKKEINLEGKWKFKTGDNSQYSKINYDDSDWEKIWVPSKWEDQGYKNYDGMAWYRIEVEITKELKEYSLFLNLGKIDDADCVYFNGKLIGKMGDLDNRDKTAYNHDRMYPLNNAPIKWGTNNLIAVQVFDRWGDGGIYQGNIGIFSTRKVKMKIDLAGEWKVKKGDRIRFKEKNYNDKNWDIINLPSNFTGLGWMDYDGYAWFRKNVSIPSKLKNEKLVLVLGKIDDADRVYFNGTLIGITGDMPESKGPHGNNSCNKNRVYYIPKHLIEWNRENFISIQVYDALEHGGIVSGPLGITTEESYLDF